MSTIKRVRVPYAQCQVSEAARQVERSMRALVKSMRRLRYAQVECGACRSFDECPIRQDLERQIDPSMAELNMEWGML